MPQPFVSVIIPVKKLSDVLFQENLPAMNTQTYRNFEVIVLPNHKSPKDIPLVSEYKWLRIIPTGKITRPAKKRDIGVQKAKGYIVAFIDDDAYPAQSWLKEAVKLFNNKKMEPSRKTFTNKITSYLGEHPVPKDHSAYTQSHDPFGTGIAAVCGPGILPQNTNIWEKTFDEVLKTWIGSGGFSYRFIQQKKRLVDDYPSMNFLIRKNIFMKLGGFNSNYWPGEDSKLCEDIVYKEQKLILYSPTVLTYHHRRNNLAGYLEQHGNYGFHRGAFFAHGDRNSRRLSYLIPTFFILYLLFIIFYSFFIYYSLFIILYIPLFIYLFLIFYLALRSFLNTKNLFIAFLSPFVLFLTHVTYGILFVKGFFTGILKKENIYQK